jgi:DNA polymerase
MKLNELYQKIENCQRCSLGKTRTKLVFGAGSDEAEVVFVGEAPGYYEDQKGEPFVGEAGKLLTELLEKIGIKRSGVYIANVLKCRPPGNRNPAPEEVEACKEYLLQQIEIIKPRIVCTLGNFATQVILGKKVAISKVKGTPTAVKGFFVFPLYHPAAALHQRWMLEPLKEDFQKLREFLNSSDMAFQLKEPEQLNLF